MNTSFHSGGPNVAIWKDGWLPASETFVRSQLSSMTRWNPVRLGYYRVEGGLPEIPEFAPYSNSLLDKFLRTTMGVAPFKSDYLKSLSRTKLIHAHFGQGGVHALPLSKSSGLPLVTTFHGQDASGHTGRGFLRDKLYAYGHRELLKSSDHLIAVSEFVADQLEETGAHRSSIRVIYTGTQPTTEVDPDSLRTNILFVGRLIEMKGMRDLLAAMKIVAKFSPDTILHVIGDGPLRAELLRTVRTEGLNVRFHGWQNSDAVHSAMERAAILCAPSHSTSGNRGEGFGMVYAEAAMRSLPIVAYKSGGALEAVKDSVTGLLVDERDIAALAEALICLLSDEVLATQMGKEGRSMAIKYFSLPKQTALLEAYYDEIVGVHK